MFEINLRCKAFAGESARTYRLSVNTDGTVLVYDAVARGFTTCHSLPKRTQDKVLQAAATGALERQSRGESTDNCRGQSTRMDRALDTIENLLGKARELVENLETGETAEKADDAEFAISEAKRLARSILANGE